MNRSESQCLSILELHGAAALTPYELYRANVLLANNGLQRCEESSLSPSERQLLQIRRLIKNGGTEEARKTLLAMELSCPLLWADRAFLLGAIAHRCGNSSEACVRYSEAAELFAEGKDEYRRIRSLINARISDRDKNSSLAGALFALQQETKRNGFHELVGIIEKARAGELLSHGRFAEAAIEAESAAESLSLDGCPEDLSVARLIAAIARAALGDLTASRIQFERVHLTGGKLSVYRETYLSILAGKVPQVPIGHPMEGTPWPKLAIKKESILGKILRRLHEGPATPDELIRSVWGEGAIHPSYRGRLFTAINKLKVTLGYSILFDGTSYRVK